MTEFCPRLPGCAVRLGRSILFLSFLLCGLAVIPARAETNSWIKATSGSWEEQVSWSLGVLPNATQDIVFTNAGFKALSISAATAQNFPASLSVMSLSVGAPAGSSNTLFLNFSGLGTPLQVSGLFRVQENGAVVVQASAVQAQGGIVANGGSIRQGDGALVTVQGNLNLTTSSYALTNGTLSVSSLEDFSFGARFDQFGGTNTVNSLQIHEDAEYHLRGGKIMAGSVTTASNNGAGGFYHHDGDVTGAMVIGTDFSGNYFFSGGTITGAMSIPSARGNGFFGQGGGTNNATSLAIGNGSRFGGIGTYILTNGAVNVSESVTMRALGTFDQMNGRHTIVSNLTMDGTDLAQFGGIAYATYTLRSGLLSMQNLSLNTALFTQSGGTNTVTGETVIGPASEPSLYTHTGGFLSTSNLVLNGSTNSGFVLAGGTHLILGTLRIVGQGPNFRDYTLNSGLLEVNNITISNGATFHHVGGAVVFPQRLTLAAGHWETRAGDQSIGRLLLTVGDTTNISSLVFPVAAATLRLNDSRNEVWNSAATLVISNWHGSMSGGGDSQLRVGYDANGLTSPQLARIRFALPGGLFPARMLATGEVVPVTTMLNFSFTENTLTLSWDAGWTLQSSTNVLGPFEDISVSNPYQVPRNRPSEFFRLRQ